MSRSIERADALQRELETVDGLRPKPTRGRGVRDTGSDDAVLREGDFRAQACPCLGDCLHVAGLRNWPGLSCAECGVADLFTEERPEGRVLPAAPFRLREISTVQSVGQLEESNMSDKTSTAAEIAKEEGLSKQSVMRLASGAGISLRDRTEAAHEKLLMTIRRRPGRGGARKNKAAAVNAERPAVNKEPVEMNAGAALLDEINKVGLALVSISELLSGMSAKARGQVMQALSALHGERA